MKFPISGALVLAFSMALGLSACGESGGGNAEAPAAAPAEPAAPAAPAEPAPADPAAPAAPAQ